LSVCSPDSAPVVWLCATTGAATSEPPAWLSAAETERLARLSGEPRGDFLASRWLIRHSLADVSGLSPADCRPEPGRPDKSAQPPGWRLSVSHSGGMAACGVSSSGSIGIDIEPLGRRARWQNVVNRWFAPDEQDWLLAGDNHQDNASDFLKVWTLKEAWLKATGRGIANNLQTLRVAPDFSLTGDRPQQHWQASLGLVNGLLVAVVYQDAQPPVGVRLAKRCNTADMGTDIADPGPIDWLFHRAINST
jgi:4'-phosphopantetheinyl transferase